MPDTCFARGPHQGPVGRYHDGGRVLHVCEHHAREHGLTPVND